MRSVCNHHSKILQHHRIIIRIAHTRTFTHTYGVCDPFVIITARFYNIHIASSSGLLIQRMRAVCNHHSKILQHHRIIIRIAHTHIHTHIQRMRAVCNHHSKILQHHRIIIIRIAHAHIHTHTYGACDPFVIITPRFYNIIASSSGLLIQRTRSVCNHHSKILQHHRIIIRIAHAHIHTHIRRMRSVCNPDRTRAPNGSHAPYVCVNVRVCDPDDDAMML